MPGFARIALVTFAAAGLMAGISTAEQSIAPSRGSRIPVLVELFTSEGCSSCPPADALLRDLLATQPVDGAFVVGLSEHVDYWNRLGWTDPFSDRAFSARQSAYAEAHRSDDVYTPQMVVDGREVFVGSDRVRALAAIAAAAKTAKSEITLRWNDNGDLDVHLASGQVRANTTVWVSIAEDGLSVRVSKGENASRTLTHDAVTRRLSQAGRTDRSGAFRQLVPIRLAGSWRGNATQVVVFAQDAGGPVLALGTARVSDRVTK